MIADSVQLLATGKTRPPSGLASVTYRRSFAPVTLPVRPLTSNLRYVWYVVSVALVPWRTRRLVSLP